MSPKVWLLEIGSSLPLAKRKANKHLVGYRCLNADAGAHAVAVSIWGVLNIKGFEAVSEIGIVFQFLILQLSLGELWFDAIAGGTGSLSQRRRRCWLSQPLEFVVAGLQETQAGR